MQCTPRFRSMDDELKFLKPAGHDQFHALLATCKLVAKSPVDLQVHAKDDGFRDEIPRLDC